MSRVFLWVSWVSSGTYLEPLTRRNPNLSNQIWLFLIKEQQLYSDQISHPDNKGDPRYPGRKLFLSSSFDHYSELVTIGEAERFMFWLCSVFTMTAIRAPTSLQFRCHTDPPLAPFPPSYSEIFKLLQLGQDSNGEFTPNTFRASGLSWKSMWKDIGGPSRHVSSV